MSTTTQLLGRIGSVVTTAAITVGLAAGIAATPASAAAPKPEAKLSISQIGQSQYKVSITGVYPMRQADAQGYINNMGTRGAMSYGIWGEEPGLDEQRWGDNLIGAAANNTPDSALHATPEGLRFHHTVVVSRSVLNEDTGWFDNHDEIYADAVFIDGDGGQRPARSKTITALF